MYKTHLAIMMTVLILSLASITSGQEVYQHGRYHLIRSNPDVPLVSAMDGKAAGAKYLAGFLFSHEKIKNSYYGRLYQFGGIGIVIGLYPSVPEAETAVIERLNVTSALVFDEWPSEWDKIGDNGWYATIGTLGIDNGYLSNILFIRKNAIIELSMSSGNYGADLKAIASAIDHDILSGSDYLKVEDRITPPVVTSVHISRQILRENEWTDVTFQASDPSGSTLKYFSNASYHEKTNTWSVTASRYSFQGEPFEGQHIIKCWVMNENNLYSSITEIPVTF